jgi:malto-oligosyltrehalose synthase/4-alpha-glucanotransferase
MLNPVSTYRIQFHKDFTFKDFEEIIPYLHQLGVKTIYASPILEASPGSMHGYDTVNPHRINPEIGTLEELRQLSAKLKALEMQWIQDIVPNHMSFHPNNNWLMDVLEKGTASAYASYFDINWSGSPDVQLMVPFLGSPLEEAIANNELELVSRDNKIYLKYFETEWPVNDQVTRTDMPLKEALAVQYYRPCHFKETNERINYRRFFTVNSLICLNIQHKKTFDDYHSLIKELLTDKVFDGLRVDHIDGLYDPEGYLEQLRELAGADTYIIIEKILEEGEELPVSWPIEGNTGYDFLARLNNLFTYQKAEKKFTAFYEHLTNDQAAITKQITAKKAAILQDFMAGELDNLQELFLGLNLAAEDDIKALKPGTLKESIGQLIIHCPVYRFYGNELPLTGENYNGLKKLLKEIASIKSLTKAVVLLEKVLLEEPLKGEKDFNIRAAEFYLRCMQFSGPLMAKGVEDTLMYTYNRFVGHNEVGDAPDAFGLSKKVIHNWMWIRQNERPLSMNATATHDTKRGEDMRARLNVLPDLTKEWKHAVTEWKSCNAELTADVDPNDEYFIYQTLIGSYPMPGMPEDNYGVRLQEYLEKALREGKTNSGWEEPDMAYEEAVQDFALRLLDPTANFWKSFSAVHEKVADFGIINSLSQILIKHTAPGMPDVYQGTELWDFSLVDPDNRRPVDYKQRKEWLDDFGNTATFLPALWEERYNGKIKLLLQHTLLQQRKVNPELFAGGLYIPLKVKGKYADFIFAFARRRGDDWFISVAPLNLSKLTKGKIKNVFELDWKDTEIILPADAPVIWSNLLTGKRGKEKLALKKVFDGYPLALLKLEAPANKRTAGILLHITSLPSPYGIGDLGQQAMKFVDFLSGAGQKYWQLLPLNPISKEQAFSPYSSVSAMAGNTLLISPDLLVKEGLLDEKKLKKYQLPSSDLLDFKAATALKEELLSAAYQNFQSLPSGQKTAFTIFCEKESRWLDDFALYNVIKAGHDHLPWYQWEPEYRHRDAAALESFAAAHGEEMLFVKWQQFIFFAQWAALKDYAGIRGVRFYGDLPFYLSYDSVEVWSEREMFSVNNDGEITGVAGVPPDYFNAEGQLWGMPVFNWDLMKKNNYQWWMERIAKNMELYDLLRLDHFRAFADYWEVPAGESTAINGEWKPGPGVDFMQVLQEQFPDLPFIAEDLGKINAAVYALRDDFKLAGMKVLQFAFEQHSEHIPHSFESDNFVVYTGTHDNNTTVGWYEDESTKDERQYLTQYAGKKVSSKNVASSLMQLAYSSIARIAILPMQDVLELDGRSRMNKPASTEDNWAWRLKEQPAQAIAKQLRKLAVIYGRG